jgi:spore coat protein CotF
MKLDDKEMAKDMEIITKHLIQSYTSAEMNAANKALRDKIQQMNNEAKTLHTSLNNIMSSRGWSKTSMASQQAIESEIITWEQKPLREPQLTK